jgi:dihydrofolate reductase
MIRYLQFFSAFASVRRYLFTFAAGALFLPGGGGGGAAVQEPRRSFQIVVAGTRERGGIGKNGQLPWKLSKDINFLKNVTSTTTSPSKKNAVVMGRCTSEFIPEKLRPLRGRFNVVQSSSRRAKNSSFDSNLFDAALALLAAPPLSSEIKFVFVIGGGQVYRSVTNLETDLFALSQLSLYVPTTVYPSYLSCVVFFFPPIHEHHQSATSIEILIV